MKLIIFVLKIFINQTEKAMTKKLFVWAVLALLVAGTGCSKEDEPKNKKKEKAPASEMDIFPELAYDELVYVEGGTFLMGAQNSDPNGLNYDSDASENESPVHVVTLDSYYIGKYEVTQEMWKKVMGTNPGYFTGNDNLPVEQVSWDDCQEFIARLNQMTGKNFRLPTEAEWEYAARGGQQDEYTRTKGQSGTYYKYAGSDTIDDVAWYNGNSGGKTHPVGTKAPNALGLYDMGGNVWEWCSDLYGRYNDTPQTNPTGSATGSDRVLRSGSWFSRPSDCRLSYRYDSSSDYHNLFIGLRLAL